jgi:cysteinyl-tRNA synthetase
MLRIYNSLTREKQDFVPLRAGEVRMYVCGITVYDYCHLGHARMMLAFDVVQRWLRASGLNVTYVRNITDIEDKIIKRAVENKETVAELTARFIEAMNEDLRALGVQAPDHEPRATSFVPQMLQMIGSWSERARLPGRGRRREFPVRKFPATAGSPASRSTTCAPASASRSTPSTIRSISCCGSIPSRTSRSGRRPGARAGPAGTSNARR